MSTSNPALAASLAAALRSGYPTVPNSGPTKMPARFSYSPSVKRRHRLPRFGAGMVTTMLETRGGGLPVVEDKEADGDSGRDMTQILTCFSARL